jgi:hypothetical protein
LRINLPRRHPIEPSALSGVLYRAESRDQFAVDAVLVLMLKAAQSSRKSSLIVRLCFLARRSAILNCSGSSEMETVFVFRVAILSTTMHDYLF